MAMFVTYILFSCSKSILKKKNKAERFLFFFYFFF